MVFYDISGVGDDWEEDIKEFIEPDVDLVPSISNDDVVIAILDNPVPLGVPVRPLIIDGSPPLTSLSPGSIVTILGFKGESPDDPNGRRRVSGEIDLMFPLTEPTKTSFRTTVRVTSGGDSGGPALDGYVNGGLYREVIVGIARSDSGYGDGLSDYMLVSPYSDWIYENIPAADLDYDRDGDGIPDRLDNCMLDPDASQDDADNDTVGDDCDVCMYTWDIDQFNRDLDELGDACDLCDFNAFPEERDADGDGVGDYCDNCVDVQNFDQIDTDGDRVGDECDNCLNLFNPRQNNCDEVNDNEEGVPLGLQGDMCDPDPCLAVRGEELFASETSSTWGAFGHENLQIGTGATIRLTLEGVGGVPDYSGDRPEFAEDTWTGNVLMSHCKCTPDNPDNPGWCANPNLCLMRGESPSGWQDSPWDREEYNIRPLLRDSGSHGDEITDVLFARPESQESIFASYFTLGWQWNQADDLADGDFAAVWLRPIEPDGSSRFGGEDWDWENWKGNTYSDLIHLNASWKVVPWVPQWFMKLYQFPPSMELPFDHDRIASALDQWEDLLRDPFEIPSILAVPVDYDTSMAGSRYGLELRNRSALSAIAIRHQSTVSGFVSGYYPLQFEGGEQLDLHDFSSTVLPELLGMPSSPLQTVMSTLTIPNDLNDVLGLWTFGGRDQSGQFYSELWRGSLDRSASEPFYRFAKVNAQNSPPPRAKSVLIADAARQRLIMFGGHSNQGIMNDMWIFELSQQKWTQINTVLPDKMGLVDAAYYVSGTKAYIYGGANQTGSQDQLWILDLESLIFMQLTDEIQTNPGERLMASLTIDPVEDILYLYGGLSQGYWRNDLWSFHLFDQVWELTEPECQPGDSCPPPAIGSTLLNSRTPGTVTIGLGIPTVSWSGQHHEYRYILSTQRWVNEDETRNIRGMLP